jgi:hypothetical protein
VFLYVGSFAALRMESAGQEKLSLKILSPDCHAGNELTPREERSKTICSAAVGSSRQDQLA